MKIWVKQKIQKERKKTRKQARRKVDDTNKTDKQTLDKQTNRQAENN